MNQTEFDSDTRDYFFRMMCELPAYMQRSLLCSIFGRMEYSKSDSEWLFDEIQRKMDYS